MSKKVVEIGTIILFLFAFSIFHSPLFGLFQIVPSWLLAVIILNTLKKFEHLIPSKFPFCLLSKQLRQLFSPTLYYHHQ